MPSIWPANIAPKNAPKTIPIETNLSWKKSMDSFLLWAFEEDKLVKIIQATEEPVAR